MNISEERAAVIKEAEEWEGTPYHHGAHLKKAGVSCSWFIASVFNNALGLNLEVIPHVEQWFFTSEVEIYLDELKKQGFVEIGKSEAQPADLILSRTCHRVYCHGGIILSWPRVIHTSAPRGVQIVRNALSSWFFGQNPDALIYLTRTEWHVQGRSCSGSG